ncbi:hypothetical protein SUGI_0663910 [Cryptomeria japonica]|uniref:protein RALF-like 34 n=1 Tax=Cryptomeria japonica TaxID=3369 RepID=UPI002414848D|nr:protein RALF-like 34 [Cryptomeria japonica]GLJ32970.1 hypothetical protein SUGI_0663910 [Cryptomeria japonica]
MGTRGLMYTATLATICVVLLACVLVEGEVNRANEISAFDVGIQDEMCDASSGECEEEGHGRELWGRRYYISYGALSADRIPCRPRSGRSYYSRNCWGRGGGAVNPYRRSCTAVTRCYRWTF